MKILRRILYFILLLVVLLCGLILLCVFKPELTETITDALNLKEKAVEEDSLAEPGKAGIAENISSAYLAPDQAELLIPEEVAGKNGYQEIRDEQEQITEQEAEQLQDQLDVGNTGDGLSFDQLYYPYYNMLDETGKHLYRQIYANANELYPIFAPVEAVTAGVLKNVFSAVYNDHPELFWVDTAYAGKFKQDGQCVEIDLKFNRTAQNLESAKAVFNENADQILSQVQNLPGNYEKEKFVHDALIDKITYNRGAEMNQSAYSALVNGQTVCAGYARAFQYLLMQLGIPCYYCTGYAGENHAWNITALDDGYYNVDTTWDDTENGIYDYFNKTDADYAGSHIRKELSVYLPPCNGQAYRNLEPERAQEQVPEQMQGQVTEQTQDEVPERAQEQVPEQMQGQVTEQTQGEVPEQTQAQVQVENQDGSKLRSLEDVGMTQEQVLTELQEYDTDCYNKIVQNGVGTYTFMNVIEGEELLEQWRQHYQNEHYKQAYMESAMTAIGASSCEMTLEIEPLQGGRYLVTHRTVIR